MDGPITLQHCLDLLAELKVQREIERQFLNDQVCIGYAPPDERALCENGIPWAPGPGGMILLSSSSMKSARELGLVR